MKISVVVTCFNHGRYLRQCLESVLRQKGHFELEIIIGDDGSTDDSRAICETYRVEHPELISLLPPEANLGIPKNLKRCLDACSGEYIAICEGDDYWTDDYKLQKQMTFLETRRDCSLCFNGIMILSEDSATFTPHPDQCRIDKQTITTVELIATNYIGNFSCCMYRTEIVRKLPARLFDLYVADWMFNIMCSELGAIGFIRDWMSVYRLHLGGAWSGLETLPRLRKTCALIEEYDGFLDHKYREPFGRYRTLLEAEIRHQQSLLEATAT